MSARSPSSRSCRRPSANDARMKRVSHVSSAARSSKRSCAMGSRSMAISVPSGPRRSATRRAWPPAPKVQSTAVSPRWGPRSSMSSPASTGTWEPVMSSRMAKALGDVVDVAGEVGVVGGPCLPVPDLEVVADAGHHDLLVELGVREQRRGHGHAPRAVELDLVGVGEEPLADLPRLLRERVALAQGRVETLVEVTGAPDLDAAVGAGRQDHALRERGAELRRDREA